MITYEMFLNEAEHEGVDVTEEQMKSSRIKGLYSEKTIWINKGLSSLEKGCIIAEEMGHYYTTYGDILDQESIDNRKQEKKARNWAFERLIPINKIIKAYEFGVVNQFEMADFLNVTEQFLLDAIDHYKEKFGLYVRFGKYTITFDPLGIIKLLD